MRVPNDKLVAKECKGVDLFLGGHDHIYYHEQIGNNITIKSGSDFKNLSLIEVDFEGHVASNEEVVKGPYLDEQAIPGKRYQYKFREEFSVAITRFDITLDLPSDPEILEHINELYLELDKKMAKVVCYLDEDQDTRFSIVRRKESSIGNFLADIIRKEHNADCSVINGGNIRADKIYTKDTQLTLGNWNDIIPFQVKVCLVEAFGHTVLKILENSVSKVPALEGRFLQVSYINFQFDADAPSGERVIKDSVLIGGKPLDLNKTYTVALPDYTLKGKDGFDVLNGVKILVDDEEARELKEIVLEFLEYTNNQQNMKEIDLFTKHLDIFTPEAIRKIISNKIKSAKQKLQSARTKISRSC